MSSKVVDITCTRRIQFCAGHRVMGHENKCANLHGHNYVAFFTARMKQCAHNWPDQPPHKYCGCSRCGMEYHAAMAIGEGNNVTDGIGRVIDFSVLKEMIGGWIDSYWDHGFILQKNDMIAVETLKSFQLNNDRGQKLFLMPGNPTAEIMAHYLLHTVCPDQLKETQVVVTEVTLWETENCYATAKL